MGGQRGVGATHNHIPPDAGRGLPPGESCSRLGHSGPYLKAASACFTCCTSRPPASRLLSDPFWPVTLPSSPSSPLPLSSPTGCFPWASSGATPSPSTCPWCRSCQQPWWVSAHEAHTHARACRRRSAPSVLLHRTHIMRGSSSREESSPDDHVSLHGALGLPTTRPVTPPIQHTRIAGCEHDVRPRHLRISPASMVLSVTLTMSLLPIAPAAGLRAYRRGAQCGVRGLQR